MNDDPTQVFPATHWKRYATERVSTPFRPDSAITLAGPIHIEMRNPNLPANEPGNAEPTPASSLN